MARVPAASASIATGFFADGRRRATSSSASCRDPPGYIWSFPRADHLAIGICAQADEIDTPVRGRDIVSTWITSSRIAPDSSSRPYSWPIPSLGAADFAAEAVGAALDADRRSAGLVDPITREGIFFALRSAQLAVDVLADGYDPAARYHEALGDDIYPELSRAARVKSNFFRGPFTRLLIDALQRSEPVRAIMRDLVAGTQPYGTLRKRLIGTFEVKLACSCCSCRSAGSARGSTRPVSRTGADGDVGTADGDAQAAPFGLAGQGAARRVAERVLRAEFAGDRFQGVGQAFKSVTCTERPPVALASSANSGGRSLPTAIG